MNIIYVIPICFVGAMLQAAFIMTEKMEQYKKAVVLKGLASLVFVGLGALGALQANSIVVYGAVNMAQKQGLFALLIAIGLALGLVGDVCLNLRLVMKDGKKVFLAGIAAFLFGHLLYLAALVSNMENYIALGISVGAGILCAAGLLIWIFKNITAQKVFKIFGIFYVGAVVVMTAVAIARVFTTYDYVMYHFNVASLVFAIGAILFTASDVILIFNMFSDKKKGWMRPANLSLYYIGQMLIAVSMFL